MTERMADIGARVQGIRQLGAVVSAMRGIAATRAQQARNQVEAVRSYSAILAASIGQAMTLAPASPPRHAAGPARLDTVFTAWRAGSATVERHGLFPLDTAGFVKPADAVAPLLNLAPVALLGALTADYVHARLCEASLQAFAAENEARMAAMASAHTEIERKLDQLQGQARIVRQEEITAEIIELAAGDAASR